MKSSVAGLVWFAQIEIRPSCLQQILESCLFAVFDVSKQPGLIVDMLVHWLIWVRRAFESWLQSGKRLSHLFKSLADSGVCGCVEVETFSASLTLYSLRGAQNAHYCYLLGATQNCVHSSQVRQRHFFVFTILLYIVLSITIFLRTNVVFGTAVRALRVPNFSQHSPDLYRAFHRIPQNCYPSTDFLHSPYSVTIRSSAPRHVTGFPGLLIVCSKLYSVTVNHTDLWECRYRGSIGRYCITLRRVLPVGWGR